MAKIKMDLFYTDPLREEDPEVCLLVTAEKEISFSELAKSLHNFGKKHKVDEPVLITVLTRLVHQHFLFEFQNKYEATLEELASKIII